jgi:alkanesulfonate monooxygenase SsuD/methylene tetrahydromethanopterin reductase-like flavin-dependent oxidoreductase (luciferase family)
MGALPKTKGRSCNTRTWSWAGWQGALARLAEYAKGRANRCELLVTEGPATDSLAVSQYIASITPRIDVGTGITNIYTRHPRSSGGVR